MIAQKIAYNIIFNGFSKVISIGIAIFSIGMLERYLGVEGFGKYSTVLQYFAFLVAFSDLGLYITMTREISRKGVNESKILNKIFTLRVLISLGAFLFLLSFITFLPYTTDVKIGVFLAGIAFLFSSSYGLLIGLFQKKLATDRVAIAELIGKITQAIVIVLAVKLDKGFVFTISSLLISMSITFFIIYFFTRKFVKLKFTWSPHYWKSFLKKSLPLGVGAIATFCYFKLDIILLGFFHTHYDVGIYGAAYKIMETLVFFPAMVVGLVFPLFSRYIFNNKEKFNKISNTTLKFFIILIIPLVISVQFLALDIVKIVGGHSFGPSAPVLQILIFALAFIFFGQLFTNILTAASKQKQVMIIFIIAAILNISINLIVMPTYSYFGAAITSVLTEFFVALSAFVILYRKSIYRPTIPRILFILLSGGIMFIIYYFSNLFLPITITLALLGYFIPLFIFKALSISELRQLLPKKNL
jgi:O-antigen/teichoic acid export membrane protein